MLTSAPYHQSSLTRLQLRHANKAASITVVACNGNVLGGRDGVSLRPDFMASDSAPASKANKYLWASFNFAN